MAVLITREVEDIDVEERPCEDTGRREPSTRKKLVKEGGTQQKQTMPTFCFWMSSFKTEKINFWCLNFSVWATLLCSPVD
jgi:hypothetical protein